MTCCCDLLLASSRPWPQLDGGEESAVNKILHKGVCVVAAAFVTAFTCAASAQGKKTIPAEKWAACSSLKNEPACKAGKNCKWTVESKDDKGTAKGKAYCRSYNPKNE
jgi:hypothetical protein